MRVLSWHKKLSYLDWFWNWEAGATLLDLWAGGLLLCDSAGTHVSLARWSSKSSQARETIMIVSSTRGLGFPGAWQLLTGGIPTCSCGAIPARLSSLPEASACRPPPGPPPVAAVLALEYVVTR
ncbi:Ethanolamine Kinase 2 [Manis pentadactyla]|nr:Ethanolamine Kinase 2 [Manis pentadactyla]